MKTYVCPCGKMEVEFTKGHTVKAKNSWCKGSPVTHLRCTNPKCSGQVRIAYTIHHLTEDGEVFHPKRLAPKRKLNAPKKRKPKKDEEVINWTFKE